MSTLAEIETAADSLLPEEKQVLIHFLALRLKGEALAAHKTDLAVFSGTVRLTRDPLAWQKRVRGQWE